MRKIDLTNFQVATSETARQINRRITLNFLRHHQPMSRADLSRRSGRQRSTVSAIGDLMDPVNATTLPAPGLAAAADPVAARRAVAAWLLACCALVFALVVVGGATRLTHSGLSIVEWQPFIGTLPPLTSADFRP